MAPHPQTYSPLTILHDARSYVRQVRKALRAIRPMHPRTCTICNYHGDFAAFGRPIRVDAQCPRCHSLERHRLIWKWCSHNADAFASPMIHFAAEPALRDLVSGLVDDYKTADLYEQADLHLNVEALDLPTDSVGTIMANHVLEHVDDKATIAEFYRVLRVGGNLIVSVPMVSGWDESYENDQIISEEARLKHFGQEDHVRYFGRDFSARLSAQPFSRITPVVANGKDSVEFGLIRGETFYVCTK